MFRSKEEYEHYKAVMHIIWDYVKEDSHRMEERELFLVVVTRLLQHQNVSLVNMIDTWEECSSSFPDYHEPIPFQIELETLPSYEPSFRKKTEPLSRM